MLPTRRQQTGVMLVFMAIFMLVFSALLLQRLNASGQQLLYQQQKHDQQALRQAKDALLGYAILFIERDAKDIYAGPGHLPCPDLQDNGEAGGDCSTAEGTNIGLFPYNTLGAQELADSIGNKLWYVLSESHRYGPNKTQPMNLDTPDAKLTVDGRDDIVAVLIAPREAINEQRREVSQPDDPANTLEYNRDLSAQYLEGENSDGDLVFSHQADNSNDRLLYISRAELMASIEKIALKKAQLAIKNYRAEQGKFPELVKFSDSPDSGNPDVTVGYLPISDTELANKLDDAESATNNDAESATNNDAESATNNDAESATNNDAESATNDAESATNNDAESATNNGAESATNNGAESATNNGAESATNNDAESAINDTELAKELPAWFVRNQWHHLICAYITQSDKQVCYKKSTGSDSCPIVNNYCLPLD